MQLRCTWFHWEIAEAGPWLLERIPGATQFYPIGQECQQGQPETGLKLSSDSATQLRLAAFFGGFQE